MASFAVVSYISFYAWPPEFIRNSDKGFSYAKMTCNGQVVYQGHDLGAVGAGNYDLFLYLPLLTRICVWWAPTPHQHTVINVETHWFLICFFLFNHSVKITIELSITPLFKYELLFD